MMDPVFAVKGAKVALVRGVTVNTNIGPQEGGPQKVQRIDQVVPDTSNPSGWRDALATDDKSKVRRRPAQDAEGKPVLVDNPKLPAAGEVSGVPDGNGRIPVRFPDGSWAMVRYQDLALIEPAPAQAGEADPVRAREADVRANADRNAALTKDVEQLKADAAKLRDELASIGGAAADTAAKLGEGIVEVHGKILALVADVEAKIHDHETKVAAAVAGVATDLQKQLGDAIAALMAKVETKPAAPADPKASAPKVATDAGKVDPPK